MELWIGVVSVHLLQLASVTCRTSLGKILPQSRNTSQLKFLPRLPFR